MKCKPNTNNALGNEYHILYYNKYKLSIERQIMLNIMNSKDIVGNIVNESKAFEISTTSHSWPKNKISKYILLL